MTSSKREKPLSIKVSFLKERKTSKFVSSRKQTNKKLIKKAKSIEGNLALGQGKTLLNKVSIPAT